MFPIIKLLFTAAYRFAPVHFTLASARPPRIVVIVSRRSSRRHCSSRFSVAVLLVSNKIVFARSADNTVDGFRAKNDVSTIQIVCINLF